MSSPCGTAQSAPEGVHTIRGALTRPLHLHTLGIRAALVCESVLLLSYCLTCTCVRSFCLVALGGLGICSSCPPCLSPLHGSAYRFPGGCLECIGGLHTAIAATVRWALCRFRCQYLTALLLEAGTPPFLGASSRFHTQLLSAVGIVDLFVPKVGSRNTVLGPRRPYGRCYEDLSAVFTGTNPQIVAVAAPPKRLTRGLQIATLSQHVFCQKRKKSPVWLMRSYIGPELHSISPTLFKDLHCSMLGPKLLAIALG